MTLLFSVPEPHWADCTQGDLGVQICSGLTFSLLAESAHLNQPTG